MSWPISRLGEVISFIRGVTFTPEDQVEPFSEGSTVVMRTKNVQVAGLDQSDLIAVPSGFVRRKEQALREGDILVSSANSWELVGKASYVPKLTYEATAGGFISIVRAKESRVDSRYLYHWVACPATQHKIRHCGRQTTNISNLDVGRFQDLEIPLPPLPEQKRIAAILDKADAIRRKRQQAIQLADDFLRAVFLDMFGDPVTNPKGWPSVKLGEVCGVGSSKRVFVDEFTDTGVPFYRGTEVGALGEGQKIQAELFISQEHYDDLVSHSGAPEVGDLLLPSICHDGRIWKVNHEEQFYFKDGRVLWIKLNRELIDSDYLRSYLQRMFLSNYSAIASGTTFAELKIVNLKAMNILSPPLALQRKFSELVKAISESGKLYANADLEGEDLFSSLAKQAFSGQL